MHQTRLNDAAIALDRVLSKAGVKFGIFGGYSITVLGGQRESKDIDCVASVNKQQIISVMNGKEGFFAVPQGRQDYVAFLWSDQPNRQNAVFVEIFCEQFPGMSKLCPKRPSCLICSTGYRHTMQDLHMNEVAITGQALGNGRSSFLDPVDIFKEKLHAAATRAKFHDLADLRWLETRYGAQIQERRGKLKLDYVGLALKRYPELTILFARIGVDINGARYAARNLDPNKIPAPAPGDVQQGLLG